MDNLKTGFWLGLGLMLAFAIWGLLQMYVVKLVKSDGR